eukprot:6209517-Pleurochrysis_carterae.AAC.1
MRTCGALALHSPGSWILARDGCCRLVSAPSSSHRAGAPQPARLRYLPAPDGVYFIYFVVSLPPRMIALVAIPV